MPASGPRFIQSLGPFLNLINIQMKREKLSSSISKSDLEKEGFIFHSIGGQYWNDSAYYVFTQEQQERLRKAAEELHAMCKYAVQHVVKSGDYQDYALSETAFKLAQDSWNRQDPYLYGRFDFAWNGSGEPKLLEYNADTPTSLLEAGKVQKAWISQALNSSSKQFTIIDQLLSEQIAKVIPATENFYCCCMKDQVEDEGNVLFLIERAIVAGIDAHFVYLEDLLWNPELSQFCTVEGQAIDNLFKLYPWEWLVRDEYAQFLAESKTKFFEPTWKQLLSNKALLAVLWKLFPNHPNLLASSFDSKAITSPKIVAKPILGREGANVTISDGSEVLLSTSGTYRDNPIVYQEYYPVPSLDNYYPTLGLWMIGDRAAGMGVREDLSMVTKNTSLFVPHIIV